MEASAKGARPTYSRIDGGGTSVAERQQVAVRVLEPGDAVAGRRRPDPELVLVVALEAFEPYAALHQRADGSAQIVDVPADGGAVRRRDALQFLQRHARRAAVEEHQVRVVERQGQPQLALVESPRLVRLRRPQERHQSLLGQHLHLPVFTVISKPPSNGSVRVRKPLAGSRITAKNSS